MQAQRQAYFTAKEYLDMERMAPTKSEYYRQPAGQWILSDHKGLDAAVAIASIDCTLPLADIYDKVEFDADPVPPVLRRVKDPEAEYEAAQRRPGMT